MHDYWELLNSCSDLGDEIKNGYFCDARDVAEKLNISVNTFVRRFGELPKFKASDIGHPEKWDDAVFCKSYGLLFVRINQTFKDAVDDYLNAKVY